MDKGENELIKIHMLAVGVTVYLECPFCKTSFHFSSREIDLNAIDQECSSCGSHGEKSASIDCVQCNNKIILKESVW